MTRRDGQGRMMLGVAVAIGSVLSISSVARAEDSFRCPTDRLIRLGDPLFEAKGICGEPTKVDQRNEKEKVGLKAKHISGGGREFIEEREITVEVEEWYYDLGTKHRARLLRFENGRLAEIIVGKHGAVAAKPAPTPDAGSSQ